MARSFPLCAAYQIAATALGVAGFFLVLCSDGFVDVWPVRLAAAVSTAIQVE